MEVFSWYFMTVKPYIQLFLCLYRVCFAPKYIFQRFIKSQRGFSNVDAGAGYTFYPLSLVELEKIIPVHSLILSSHLFFCLHLLCPAGSSLLNQKTLRRGQNYLSFRFIIFSNGCLYLSANLICNMVLVRNVQ